LDKFKVNSEKILEDLNKILTEAKALIPEKPAADPEEKPEAGD